MQGRDLGACEITENICIALCPLPTPPAPFLAQSSYHSYDFLSDRSTRRIFCSNIWSLTLDLDTELLNPLEFPG